jgi:exodeoxyribonuclease V alpha subunit
MESLDLVQPDAVTPATPPAPCTLHAKELTGTVREIRQWWKSDDGESGTVIASLHGGNVVKGYVESETALEPELSYKFNGHWVDHPRYGPQFNFTSFLRALEHTERGITLYLAKVADGVGRVKAKALWDVYGPDAVRILTNEPQRVADDGVMSLERATEAAASLIADEAHQAIKIDLADLFLGRGFPGKLVDAVIARWRHKAAEVIRRDPFRLLTEDLPGCGFIRCDKLHQDLGHNPRDTKRVGMCAWDQVAQATARGHTWHPIARVYQLVAEKIGADAAGNVTRAVRLMTRAHWIHERQDAGGVVWLAERASAIAERLLARKIRDLLACPPRWPTVPTDGMEPDQVAVLDVVLKNAFAILLGTPGSGKTFLAARIIKAILAAHGQHAVAVCAPTGKAAVRMTAGLQELGLNLKAQTIHSLLGVLANTKRDGWRFNHCEDKPLPFRFVVVDESSMNDVPLAAALLSACSTSWTGGCNVLWVGDPYQLPPVGHGAPLRDLIAACPQITGELTTIKRNAGLIVQACRQIKDGRSFATTDKIDLRPESVTGQPSQNLRMVEVLGGSEPGEPGEPDQVGETIGLLYGKWLTRKTLLGAASDGSDLPIDPVWDVQVLCATNKRRKELNRILQQLVNPAGQRMPGRPFRVADKVMCLQNGQFSRADRSIRGATEYYVANGDMGDVVELHEKHMVVRLRGGPTERLIRVPMGPPAKDVDLADTVDDTESNRDRGAGCEFCLAYCCTTHKYQGSECPVVVVVVDKAAGLVASREWHYTAISRAKKLCILVGQQGVIEQQCRRVAIRDRKTFLVELIKEEGETK